VPFRDAVVPAMTAAVQDAITRSGP
jgi:hypothetical protein